MMNAITPLKVGELCLECPARADQSGYLRVLDAALQAVGFGIWRWNLQTDEIMWDQNMFQVFDQDPNLFIPTYANFFNLMIPEDRRRIDADVRKAIKDKSDWMDVFRIIKSNGDIGYIRAYGKVYNGAPFMAGINIPISAQDFADSLIPNAERMVSYEIRDTRRKIWRLRQKMAQMLCVESELEVTPPEGYAWTDFGELVPGAMWRRINAEEDEDLIIEFKAQDDTLELHYHNFDELVVCRSGKMRITVEDDTVTLLPGQSIFIPSYRYHKKEWVGPSACYVTWFDFYTSNNPLLFVGRT
jgi:mannose-6-phosphate isomerase-like protein (cupin superfamily)